MAEDYAHDGADDVQRETPQQIGAERHAEEWQHVILCEVRRARQQHRELRERSVRGIGQAFAERFHKLAEEIGRGFGEGVTREQLDENGSCREHQAETRAEADARRHMQNADGKSDHGQKGHHDENRDPVHALCVGVHSFDVDETVEKEQTHDAREGARKEDPLLGGDLAPERRRSGHRAKDPAFVRQFGASVLNVSAGGSDLSASGMFADSTKAMRFAAGFLMTDASKTSAGIYTRVADLNEPAHQAAVLAMIDSYACDAMGDGKPLSAEVRARLIPGLRAHPTTLILLAWEGEKPVGIAVCFLGFSTFAARPLVNIHDCMVLSGYRGRGVGRLLLEAVEARARELGCCKLTLEVLENNTRALRTYQAAGFARYVLQAEAGGAIFMSKPLG